MSVQERDPLTGQVTTGHEWDGIKELRTPIPNWWLITFIVTWVLSIGYLVLYPSFATTKSYAPGILGWSSRNDLSEATQQARDMQSAWRNQILATPLEQIEDNEELRRFAVAGGVAAFNENCAACHGVGAVGQIGQFPSLIDDDWLWGGTITDIHTTIRHGIRTASDDARASEMPAFGDVMTGEEIVATADYVLSLSDRSLDAMRASMPGAALFADNCESCHGAGGEGNREFGAPRLNDAIWLYGGTRDAVIRQITQPKMGQMPTWESRLDEGTIRMLAVYVHTLGGGEK
ncbi:MULTISPECIES: cytochrome-c oxidase, cbb3-type subunit III [unclassified Sinorhizobium]|uniref:cytochrome-c oxidase, cbb3-type subunit III n=1 Tax=unclassified Sinorhizobium TaxID=2613772 RepID=UPI0024C40974|nr:MULTISPECIES: cytochrome-c oxidase, cbb3-type subunit III [unclassified Sinorhizobium]MDK1376804.1 cytochrome-c oxidase, cbb3-type subunit III [Sinorhizobium sp. 6-70]MDK1479576.1 cytochrome-c oxidase, cbb3-type subunit III [Sinorhizobium sp. 6-117]